ncbi:MAG TPA: carboxypeptidase-like regulatory domain-containing protein, partial [Flavobacterium sp.]|uniref:carboxypeptidase-like regulatory domain-containing protein n=1 Tax=Flavobacterium sp. TaxID=239 RepID=UPI002F4114F3
MNIRKIIFVFIALLLGFSSFAQSARVKGVILDINNQPIGNVNVSCSGSRTQTNLNGFYSLKIPENQKVTITFTHVSLKKATVSLSLKTNEEQEFNLVMNDQQEQMGEIIVTTNNKKRVQGLTTIAPEVIRKMPGANAGIENILKTLPGVNSNNELSTQYAVRGGNYDENLVYVNEIEIYRPFLIRSGQQEGLSFTNTDLVQNVDFSAGGFQAKFGDKLSSVLDITYRKPSEFGVTFEASFLGGSFSVDAISRNKKWTAITGVRYRNNSLLVKSQDTQTNYTPTFADIQTNINYQASAKWQWSFLGNISQNSYKYQP